MQTFFYGLFMDETLLARRGIKPASSVPGCVNGYVLRIGERATLAKDREACAYGVLMELGASDVKDLYSEESVADYLPESLEIELSDGSTVEATCYNLPEDKVQGTNRAYAAALLELATNIRLPDTYLLHIRRFTE